MNIHFAPWYSLKARIKMAYDLGNDKSLLQPKGTSSPTLRETYT